MNTGRCGPKNKTNYRCGPKNRIWDWAQVIRGVIVLR